MKTHIHIENAADCCHIEIEGTIGVPEEWQFDHPDQRVATYERFREAVARIAEVEAPEVIVTIRSTGGDVNDALLIHDALRQLGGRITTRCYGYTASAATIIAQAASEGCRELSANALYLIHQATCATEGNAAQLAEQMALLSSTDDRLASLYATRSGREIESFRTLMAENNGNGRWLSPEEAIAAGLADRLIGDEEPSMPTEEPTLVQNIARGWQRLMHAVGLQHDEPLPEDLNILHPKNEPLFEQRRTMASLLSGQQAVRATEVEPVEDPSIGEERLSANERAYAQDVKQLKRTL